jgi:isopentenyl diphosphate isomerase/L-lactate dehydrogenase-like FMN-dependent dehydrogenase
MDLTRNRRQFLRFLAASPLLSRVSSEVWAQENAAIITKPEDAVDVMDFMAASRKALPPAHWGYMATGVDDDLTLKANMDGFKHFQLRPRRLVDVSKADMRIELFGSTWESPIFICPVGGQKAFHPEGEVAVARAAKAKKVTQILSTQTSSSIEDVAKALGTAPWYQLYMPLKWADTEKMIRRVEATGCPALAWTVDLLAGRNTETAERFRRIDTRDCLSCHPTASGGGSPRPMFAGLPPGFNPPEATWAYVDRLKKMTSMKLLLKGLDNAEDAKLAVEHGVDGILLSNHGGRATETLRATIECLPEVVDAVNGRIPVLIDGGFRRGSDVYKALALGARAAGIGRPYIYGLSAFGQPGVEKVIDLLRAELRLVMRQCGTPSIAQITRASIRHEGA